RRTTQPENPFSRLTLDQTIAIVPEFTFESGYTIRNVPVAYKTWGVLNETGDNCMLICHPLTRSADIEDWYIYQYTPIYVDPKVQHVKHGQVQSQSQEFEEGVEEEEEEVGYDIEEAEELYELQQPIREDVDLSRKRILDDLREQMAGEKELRQRRAGRSEGVESDEELSSSGGGASASCEGSKDFKFGSGCLEDMENTTSVFEMRYAFQLGMLRMSAELYFEFWYAYTV
ncbi:homoserine O- acetyltransferase, partial [Modicella reniformis]